MIERDHRDDGNAIAGVFFALPLGLAVWLGVLGVILSPWLFLPAAIVLAIGLHNLRKGSSV